jgi:hypothetical protein
MPPQLPDFDMITRINALVTDYSPYGNRSLMAQTYQLMLNKSKSIYNLFLGINQAPQRALIDVT